MKGLDQIKRVVCRAEGLFPPRLHPLTDGAADRFLFIRRWHLSGDMIQLHGKHSTIRSLAYTEELLSHLHYSCMNQMEDQLLGWLNWNLKQKNFGKERARLRSSCTMCWGITVLFSCFMLDFRLKIILFVSMFVYSYKCSLIKQNYLLNYYLLNDLKTRRTVSSEEVLWTNTFNKT